MYDSFSSLDFSWTGRKAAFSDVSGREPSESIMFAVRPTLIGELLFSRISQVLEIIGNLCHDIYGGVLSQFVKLLLLCLPSDNV